jgi:hypothetical protein
LSDFNETLIFSTDFRKKSQISSFIKIRPVKAELFHADGQTDGRTEGHTDGRTNNGHDEANGSFLQLFEHVKMLPSIQLWVCDLCIWMSTQYTLESTYADRKHWTFILIFF